MNQVEGIPPTARSGAPLASLTGATHFAELLEARARQTPDRNYLTFEGRSHSYAEVFAEATQCRHFLERRGVGFGDHVVLVLDNGPRFFAAFFGAQLCGAVPVPLSPKSPEERIDAIVSDCAAALILVDEAAAVAGARSIALSASSRAIAVSMSAIEALGPVRSRPAARPPVAFVQYTSGSMGNAKGAVISHRAALANIRGFTQALAIDPQRDVVSSMMPLFPDMGLVCFGLGTLYTGAPLVLYRQEAISLYHWLDGFARHGVTVTGGPNIFLHLANRVVRDPSKYDLRTLRAFICGSEPISPQVVRTFEAKYGVEGTVKPAYGMAEITLCATITGASDACRVIDDRYMSCGKPLPQVDVRILTGDRLTREAYVSGEVIVETPSLMDGYLRRPDLTAEAMHGRGYASGDVGFLDEDGRIYITGRKSNLIVRGGEKFAPSDLEAIASLESDVQLCAVVGVEDTATGAQAVVLVAEVDKAVRSNPDKAGELARRIAAAARKRIGYGPDRVVFAPKGRIPTTLNGKTRHAALRTLLASGNFSSDAVVQAADLNG